MMLLDDKQTWNVQPGVCSLGVFGFYSSSCPVADGLLKVTQVIVFCS